MPDNLFNNRRPTPLEDKAHAEMVGEFSENFKQFAQAQRSIQDVKNLTTQLADQIGAAAGRQPKTSVQADDGNEWTVGQELMERVFHCHRPTSDGMEFAVIERLDMRSGTSYALLDQGNDAEAVLRAFLPNEDLSLSLWTEDMSSQVTERLAEKYPGQDLSRVVESIVNRWTNARLSRQTINHAETQKRGRRIGI